MEVMRRTLELTETCVEGLRYINDQLCLGVMEKTVYLLEDTVHGYCQIVEALTLLNPFLPDQHIHIIKNQIELLFNQLISSYEQRDINSASYQLNQFVLPSFLRWRDELAASFQAYILS